MKKVWAKKADVRYGPRKDSVISRIKRMGYKEIKFKKNKDSLDQYNSLVLLRVGKKGKQATTG